MKIGIIIPQNKFLGGGPRLGLELANALKKEGHTVIVWTFRYNPADTYYNDLVRDLDIRSLPENTVRKPRSLFGNRIPGTSTVMQYLHEQELARELAAMIDSDLDLLNPHGRLGSLVGAFYKKRKPKVPVVWQMNDVPLLRWTQCDISVEGGNGSTVCSPGKKLFYNLVDRYYRARFLPALDRISVLDSQNQARAKKYLSRHADILRSGADAAHFAYKERSAITGKNFTLLAHAQFYPHRRFEDAIDATALLVKKGFDPKLIISGDCQTYRAYRDYRESLEKRATELGIRERVHFPGKLSEEELLATLGSADIFLYPHHMQTWGLIVFEAMATGLPALVSRTSGAHEVLTDGKNSLFIEAKNPLDIAVKVEMLATNPTLYKQLSTDGAAFVRREITWENYARDIVRLAMESARKQP